MNNILWQQNSCPCNEYSAEAGWPANRRSRLMETRTQINHLREEIDKMEGNSLVHQIKLLITWVILVSLQIFHVFIIHKISIIEIGDKIGDKKMSACIWNERETTLACWLFSMRNLFFFSYRSLESSRVSISLDFILNNLWFVKRKKI